jgi:hypothetical protein
MENLNNWAPFIILMCGVILNVIIISDTQHWINKFKNLTYENEKNRSVPQN